MKERAIVNGREVVRLGRRQARGNPINGFATWQLNGKPCQALGGGKDSSLDHHHDDHNHPACNSSTFSTFFSHHTQTKCSRNCAARRQAALDARHMVLISDSVSQQRRRVSSFRAQGQTRRAHVLSGARSLSCIWSSGSPPRFVSQRLPDADRDGRLPRESRSYLWHRRGLYTSSIA